MSRPPRRFAPVFACFLLLLAAIPALASWETAPRAFVILRTDSNAECRAFVDLLTAAGGHASVVFPPNAAVVYANASVLGAPEIRTRVAESHDGAIDAAAIGTRIAAYGESAARATRAWNLALEMRETDWRLPPGFVPPADAGPARAARGNGPIVPRTMVSDDLPYGVEYYDTSEYMAGSTAVGVWLLEAAGATYDWSQAEEDQTLAGVQAGLDKWVEHGGAPTNLTFFLDIHTDVPVSGVPITSPQSDDYVWMDEVMTNAGWTGSDAWDKCVSYNNAIRDTFDTNWCYSIVIVDSDPTVNQGLFAGGGYAWADYGGPWVYMSRYSSWAFNAGSYFGVVPMHETGHIFFDTDEYDGVVQTQGYLNVPDNINASVICIMNQNDSTRVCLPTKRQLGWRDQDADGIVDIHDTEPAAGVAAHSPDPTSNPTPTWTGSANVTTIPNMNPFSRYSPPHAMTLVKIGAVECRVDGDAWTAAIPSDGSFDDYVEGFSWTSPPLADGVHIVEARATNSVGNVTSAFGADTVTVLGSPVGVEPPAAASAPLALEPNEPNPVRGMTTFRYSLPVAGPARLTIFAADGSLVRALLDGPARAGANRVVWDGRDGLGRAAPTGLYVFRLDSDAGSLSRKLVVVR